MVKQLPVLNLLEGEIAVALLTIGIGIVMEKWYVSWWSVGINVLSFFVALMTLDLEPYSMALLLGYTVLGGVSAWKRWNKLYFLFGSKTYGALMLALGSLNFPSWRAQLLGFAASLGLTLNYTVYLVAFTWGLYFVVVHIVGEIYNRVAPSIGPEPEPEF
jgi:hypothetical protein